MRLSARATWCAGRLQSGRRPAATGTVPDGPSGERAVSVGARSSGSGRRKVPDRELQPRRRATHTRPHGVGHLFTTYDLAKDQLYGHIKKTKNRSEFLEFCRDLRSLHPREVRIAIVCDNYSPHPTTKRGQRVGTWAEANNVEIAYTPTNSSWHNRIEAQFTALRYFTVDGTGHATHKAQGSMIRRYIIWRNNRVADQRLREVINRANVA